MLRVGRDGIADGQHAARTEEHAGLGIDRGSAAIESERTHRLGEAVEIEPAARVDVTLNVRDHPVGTRRELLDAATDTDRPGIDVLRASPRRRGRHRHGDDPGTTRGKIGRSGAGERTGPSRVDVGETDAEGARTCTIRDDTGARESADIIRARGLIKDGTRGDEDRDGVSDTIVGAQLNRALIDDERAGESFAGREFKDAWAGLGHTARTGDRAVEGERGPGGGDVEIDVTPEQRHRLVAVDCIA